MSDERLSWHRIFRDAKHDAISGGWLANLVIGFALLLVGPLVGAYLNNPKLMFYGAATALTILVWLAAVLVARQIAPTSQASVEASEFSKSPPEFTAPQQSKEINQTMTDSPGGIQAGRDAVVNQKTHRRDLN